MGIIIGKFRKKKTTLEVLENLEKHIKTIEDYGKNTEQAQKRIVGRFLVISICVYLLTAFIFYFYFFPASFYDRLYYIIPLILAPVIIVSTKKVLTWYYHRKLRKNETNLAKLKNEKKDILEKVMDTETYKVAKTILEKFAPEQVRKPGYMSSSSDSTPVKPSPTMLSSLRQRSAASSQLIRNVEKYNSKTVPLPLAASAIVSVPPGSAITRFNTTPMSIAKVPIATTTLPLPLPREILPRERSVIDKMVEYLVGDGPSNRYALICKQCSSHNGMALKEEFEYISFRCCYCLTMNPARKQRLQAPKLTYNVRHSPPSIKDKTSDTSESEKNSSTDTESDEDNNKKEVKTLYNSNIKSSDNEKSSDFDKLSDLEQKLSDNELNNDKSKPISSNEDLGKDEVVKKVPDHDRDVDERKEMIKLIDDIQQKED